MTKIHQRQLRALRLDQVIDATGLYSVDGIYSVDAQIDFGRWLAHHVGEYNKDWGRTYNQNPLDADYGCSWWFRDPQMATLTLLRWN
jgi:hypothetical protein